MRFWDSSAIVPLLVEEAVTSETRRLYREDPALTVWWGTPVECVSALTRLERERSIPFSATTLALAQLDALAEHWSEVQASDAVRGLARRLLRVHSLRAADSLQLAAALCAAEHQPATLDFVTFDVRLAEAAAREGFAVLPTGAEFQP